MSKVARVGIGGPVGCGKTALIEQIVPLLSELGIEVGIITNDLLTTEDADRLKNGGVLSPDRIIKTGSPMYEVLHKFLSKIESSEVLTNLGLEKHKFVILNF